jgi:hypothetical protein
MDLLSHPLDSMGKFNRICPFSAFRILDKIICSSPRGVK